MAHFEVASVVFFDYTEFQFSEIYLSNKKSFPLHSKGIINFA